MNKSYLLSTVCASVLVTSFNINAAVVNFEFDGSFTSVYCGQLDCSLAGVDEGDSVTGQMSIDFGAEDGINDIFGDAEILGFAMQFPDSSISDIEPGISIDNFIPPSSGSTGNAGELIALSIETDTNLGRRQLLTSVTGGSLYGNGGSSIIYEEIHFDGTWSVSNVPIPPAMWLFGSGLLGLIGIARKKAA